MIEPRGVVVTRPAGTGEALVADLRSLGEAVFEFPAIEIKPLELDAETESALQWTERFDMAIFISPSAVAQWFARAQARWPAKTCAAAVGSGTAAALSAHGVANVIAPDAGAGGQALLARDELARVEGMTILSIAGQGGSTKLVTALEARGAKVTRAALYRREPPKSGKPLFDWLARHPSSLLLVTSLTALDNLARLGNQRERQTLLTAPLVAPSPRVVQHARQLGYRDIIRAADAIDATLTRAVAQWRESHL